MLFTLEALDAAEGDALLLHYGSASNPKLLIIDGGPRGVYKQTLKPRLEEYRHLRDLDGPIPVKLAMVSHIDADHIAGIIDLFRDVEDAIEDDDEPLIDTSVLWHNSFDDILGNNQVASVASYGKTLEGQVGLDHSLSLVAGVGQGRKLRDIAAHLSLAVNAPFSRYVQARDKPLNLGNGLSLRVLGPSRDQLDELQADWDKKLKKLSVASAHEKRAAIASFSDKSAANLSSIVAVAKAGGKTMLLTGDARGDFIEDSLRDAGLLVDGSVRFDLFKVPHHGSDRNVSTSFFKKVTSDHYVFSANGKHDNPDDAALTMLTRARGADRYTMHFTNRLPHVEAFIEEDRAKYKRRYKVVYRDDDYYSVWIDLGDRFDF